MNYVDIIVLTLTILLIVLIIFFSYIFPRLRGKKTPCDSCAHANRGKKILKKYHRKYKTKQPKH